MNIKQKKYWYKHVLQKLKSKKQGSTLLVAILLGGMMLSLSAGTAKILMKEVEFTSDLLFAEKAYFAAESGVEMALLELNELPVRNIKDQVIRLGKGASTQLNIENRVETFDLTLEENGNKKFQLRRQKKEHDNDPDPVETLSTDEIKTEKITSFSIDNPENKKFHWKVLCKHDKKTVAIQDDFQNANFNSGSVSGILEDENGAIIKSSSLDTFLQNTTYQNCFLSLENLNDNQITLTLKSTQEMAPDKAKITSIGASGKREKRIVFDYAQKNLGSLFDFVFFHSDEGI